MYVGVGQFLQAAQDIGGAGGPGERGQVLVQGEFVGSAGAGKTRSPQTWGSSGGSWARLGRASRFSGSPASRAWRSTRPRTYT